MSRADSVGRELREQALLRITFMPDDTATRVPSGTTVYQGRRLDRARPRQRLRRMRYLWQVSRPRVPRLVTHHPRGPRASER